MKTILKFILPVLFLSFYSSCKKDENIISAIPLIEFISVGPSQFIEYQSTLTFTISYRDGDGNLGENNPDVTNLFLTDNRNNVTYKYRVQQLAPEGSSIAIEGKLNIVLNNTGITDNSNSQTFTYSIYLVDRAGNTSNTVTTSAVTVTK